MSDGRVASGESVRTKNSSTLGALRYSPLSPLPLLHLLVVERVEDLSVH